MTECRSGNMCVIPNRRDFRFLGTSAIVVVTRGLFCVILVRNVIVCSGESIIFAAEEYR